MTNETTAAAAATKLTIEYEQITCTRCGGGGSYSYCSMYGSTCFKCKGRGKVTSAAGQRAHAKVEAFKAEHFSKLSNDLRVGDRIVVDGIARTIAAIQTTGGSRYGIGKDEATGETIWADYISVTFDRPIKTAWGPCSGHGFCQGMRVQLAVGGENWLRVIEFARTIKGKGLKIVETPVAK